MNKKLINTIAVIVFVLAVFFGRNLITDQHDGETPTPVATVRGAATQDGPAGLFTAYFTDPPLNADIPGIETNLIALIDNAETSVHGAMYELDLPDITDALVRAKQRGLEVGLVYDNGQMTKPDRMAIIAKLIQAGIPIIPDNRSAFMHDKFFVIDGNTVWTGSFNYTGNAAHKNNENAVVFRSTQLAANYEKEFSEMFDRKLFGPKSPSDTPYPTLYIEGVQIGNYFAPEDDVMAKVIAAVKGARSSVDFLSFLFTDVNLGYSMTELALNDDVAIRGVFETNQDMGDSVCPYMLLRSKNIEGNGSIEVKLDGNPAVMHEKVIIIDSAIVVFGSFNFSRNADESNDENLLIVYDPRLAQEFEQEFQKVYDAGVIPVEGCKKP